MQIAAADLAEFQRQQDLPVCDRDAEPAVTPTIPDREADARVDYGAADIVWSRRGNQPYVARPDWTSVHFPVPKDEFMRGLLPLLLCLLFAPAAPAQTTPGSAAYPLTGLTPPPVPTGADPAVRWIEWAANCLDVPRSSIRVEGDQLLVPAGSRSQVLAQALAEVRVRGHRQVLVEFRVMTVPESIKVQAGGRQAFPPGPRSFVYPQSERPSGSLRTGTTISREAPFARAVLTDGVVGPLMRQVQAGSQGNILLAPKVVLFNGQKAAIDTGTQRPFVVGFDFLGAAVQPRIRVESEGLNIDCCAVATGRDSVSLRIAAVARKIVEVVEQEVGTEAGQPLTVQIPEIRESVISTEAIVPLGQTLLLGGHKVEVERREPERGIRLLGGFRRSDPVAVRRWLLVTPRPAGDN